MADVLPKLKMWIFTSILAVFVNIGITITKINIGITDIISLVGGAFIPFVSLTSLIGTNYPGEVTALIGLILGIVSAIQAYLLISIIANYIPTVNV